MPKPVKALNPCLCGQFDALPAVLTEEQIEDGNFLTWSTGCTDSTVRAFAPGHDAKLKSFLITHGAAGHEVRYVGGGMATSSDAITLAGRFGFAHQVKAGIDKATAPKTPKRTKAERDASIAARIEAAHPAPVPEPVVEVVEPKWYPPAGTRCIAKVGRWEYPGELSVDGLEFSYFAKGGVPQVATKFSIVG